jgi:alpha-1,3-rhamnosyl/mannosyltransferase
MTHSHVAATHEENNVFLATEGMRWLDEHGASFIAVSQHTQQDVQRSGRMASLVYEGVDRRVFYPVINQHLMKLVRERYSLPSGSFLLSVATIEPRKNLQRLIDAYAMLDGSLHERMPLVLAGRKGWKEQLKVPKNVRHRVHFIGYVREDHLPALYTMATGFCYVSLYEGFGLPVLEAMACGCPVLVSAGSSLPELVGEHGLLCDPLDTTSIASGLQRLLDQDGEEAGWLAMKASWKFTWRSSWLKTVELLIQGNIDS